MSLPRRRCVVLAASLALGAGLSWAAPRRVEDDPAWRPAGARLTRGEAIEIAKSALLNYLQKYTPTNHKFGVRYAKYDPGKSFLGHADYEPATWYLAFDDVTEPLAIDGYMFVEVDDSSGKTHVSPGG